MVKLHTALTALFLLAPVAAQAADACQLPKGWMQMKTPAEDKSNAGKMSAALKITPAKIEVGEPFTVDIAACGMKQGAIERIIIDASMPAHKHGMNYRPKVKKLSDNTFRGENMLFHMPGKWRIDFAAFQNGKPTRMMLEVVVE